MVNPTEAIRASLLLRLWHMATSPEGHGTMNHESHLERILMGV